MQKNDKIYCLTLIRFQGIEHMVKEILDPFSERNHLELKEV